MFGSEDQDKSKAQLVGELHRLRDRIAALESGAAARAAATVEWMPADPPAARLESATTSPFDDLAAQQVAAMLPCIVYIYDLIVQRSVLWNSMVENILGYSPDEVLAMEDAPGRILHPDDLEGFPEQLRRFARLADGEVNEWQYRARHANGSYRWLHDHQVVLRRLADGTAHHILGVAHDITAFKEVQDAVQRSHRRLLRQSDALLGIVRSGAMASGDRERGLAEITEVTSRTLDVAEVSVYLFDASRGKLACHDIFDGTSGRHTRGPDCDASAFTQLSDALSANRVLAIEDAEHDLRVREVYHSMTALRGVTSVLEAGVRRGNVLIGMLCCNHRGPARKWMVEEETFAGSMADLVVRVLDSSDNRRLEEFQAATLRIAEVASRDRDPEALFRLARTTLAAATGANSVRIALRDPAGEELQEIPADSRVDSDASYARGVHAAIVRVLASGHPLYCERRELVETQTPASSSAPGVWYGVPLLSGSDALGVLALEWDHAPETGGAALPRFLGEVASHLAHAVERAQREHALRDRARQQEAAAELGLLALGITDTQRLFDTAVRLVARALDVEYCKILELLPDGHRLILRSGVGWREGLIGTAVVSAGLDSQAGYTLLHGGPVLVGDLRRESRFQAPALLLEHGVVSGMSTVVHSGVQRRFVLGAHTSKRREFTWDDAMFLQAAANVVAVAMSRLRMQSALLQSEERAMKSGEHARNLQEDQDFALQVVNGLPQPVLVNDENNRCIFVNPAGARFLDYSIEELLGKDALSFTLPEDRPLVAQARKDRQAGETTTYELRMVASDGRAKLALVTGAPRYRAGKFIGSIAVALDLEPLKAAQQRVLALESQARQLERERRLHVVQAQDEERAALSHEIHEGLGQLMVGLHMTLVARNRSRGDLANEIASARQAVAAASQLSRRLLPPELQSSGVFHVVAKELCTSQDADGPSIRAHCSGDEPEFEQSKKALLYRIASFAVERAVRVGHASSVELFFTWSGSDLDLRVADDGRNIPDEEADLALRSIRDRVALLDGEMRLDRTEDRNLLLIRLQLRDREHLQAPAE